MASSSSSDDCFSPSSSSFPDFSTLSDVVWVKVLMHLSIEDRYYCCRTCMKLCRLAYVPSLWRSVTLVMEHGMHDYKEPPLLDPQHGDAVTRFGHFFRHVSLIFKDFCVHERSVTLLKGLAGRMELRSLHVTVYNTIIRGKRQQFDAREFLHSGCNLFTILLCWMSLPKVRKLSVFFPNYRLNGVSRMTCRKIYNILNSGEAFVHLHTLDLRGEHDENQLYEINQVTEGLVAECGKGDPSRWPTATLLRNFPCLQHLTLSAFNLSDELLQELSNTEQRRCQLLTLHTEVKLFLTEFLPELSSSSWSCLASACPDLQVTCHVGNWSHDFDLRSIIKPETPLVQVHVDVFGLTERSVSSVIDVCIEHVSSLKSFVCLTKLSSKFKMASLVATVNICSALEEFEFHGSLLSSDVIQMKSGDRKWRRFVVVEDTSAD